MVVHNASLDQEASPVRTGTKGRGDGLHWRPFAAAGLMTRTET